MHSHVAFILASDLNLNDTKLVGVILCILNITIKNKPSIIKKWPKVSHKIKPKLDLDSKSWDVVTNAIDFIAYLMPLF